MGDWEKFIKDYQTILAAIIAVVIGVIGWIINYQLTLRVQNRNHLLTIKAQNNNLLNKLYNTARLEITTGLRIYQGYLSESIISEYGFNFNQEREVSLKYDEKWLLRILEYITLFPEVKPAYDVISSRHYKIIKKCSTSRFEFIEVRELINYQINLVEDLIMYLQIRSFSQITGNPMAEVKYNDDDNERPKFIINEGKLEYVEGNSDI